MRAVLAFALFAVLVNADTAAVAAIPIAPSAVAVHNNNDNNTEGVTKIRPGVDQSTHVRTLPNVPCSKTCVFQFGYGVGKR